MGEKGENFVWAKISGYMVPSGIADHIEGDRKSAKPCGSKNLKEYKSLLERSKHCSIENTDASQSQCQ